ncbi:MAG TPA: heparan-alpha-glucosaminide N-acetyltransferase domain-containing protein [Candidatus Acidoferrales bacterium]|nr:heparan-alpha-glucosaminide N-acetyltransferase domain-containing protein [Candidatus Acidoferrales bacterium]
MSQTQTALSPSTAPAQRLLSLDVFRGLTVAFMILVNNGHGPSYRPLLHAEWNGWTPTDLVFPSFLFIVGVSIVLSTASRIERGESRTKLLGHAFRRAVVIFVLGLLIFPFPHYHLATWRIPGVLQRIALCYFAAAVLYLYAGKRARWAWMAGLLICYWVVMRFVPVPGFGVPGVDIPLLHQNNNLVAWLDRKLMMGHLYEGVRDPEGLLSTLPAIVNPLAGIMVGEWIRELRGEPSRLLKRLSVGGMLCIISAEFWNLIFPINKKLWTSSYVLLTVGIAMLVLAACYCLLDVKRIGTRAAWPALVFGTNAIVAYAFSELLVLGCYNIFVDSEGKLSVTEWWYRTMFGWIRPPQVASLCYAIAYTAMCWLFTYALYRKRIFIKV